MKQMKVVLIMALVVVCLTSVASATRYDTIDDTTVTIQASSDCVSAVQSCAAANASCTSARGSSGSVTLYYECPSGTYASDSSRGSTCYCRAVESLAPSLGVQCKSGDQSGNKYLCRQKSPNNGDLQYYWFSPKREGDVCSGSFDCLPPRRCIDGKCYNQLSTGDTCYNTSSSPTISLTSSCSVKDYCPYLNGGIIASAAVCTPRLAAGADCTTAASSACPSYLACDNADGSSGDGAKTCRVARMYWIPAGQKANTSESDCYDGMWDGYTNRTCLSYDTIYAMYLPSNGVTCSSTLGATGGVCSYGTCQCTSTTSTATACTWSKLPHATLVSNRATSVAKSKKYYDAACDIKSSSLLPSSSNSDYCAVRLGDWTATYTACNTGVSTMVASSMTLLFSGMIATVMMMVAMM